MGVGWKFRGALSAGLFLSVLYVLPALAATVASLQPISFGTIIADPTTHETIEIDARIGPATTQKTSSGYSHISTPGSSGVIRVSSGTPFSCSLFFPASTTMSAGGQTMHVDQFSGLSMAGGSVAGGGVLDLHVGGRLSIQRGQGAGAYSGSVVAMVIIE